MRGALQFQRVGYAENARRHGARALLRPRLARVSNVPAANVGRNHPDYGMTPAEHWAAKKARV
jgi:hypothetical protein